MFVQNSFKAVNTSPTAILKSSQLFWTVGISDSVIHVHMLCRAGCRVSSQKPFKAVNTRPTFSLKFSHPVCSAGIRVSTIHVHIACSAGSSVFVQNSPSAVNTTPTATLKSSHPLCIAGIRDVVIHVHISCNAGFKVFSQRLFTFSHASENGDDMVVLSSAKVVFPVITPQMLLKNADTSFHTSSIAIQAALKGAAITSTILPSFSSLCRLSQMPVKKEPIVPQTDLI